MERLNRDFYIIEQQGDKKRIHVLGCAYDSENGSETPYIFVEYDSMYIPFPPDMPFGEFYDNAYNIAKPTYKDYSHCDIVDVLNNYFETPPVELDYCEITADTPCGYYIER